MSHLALSLLTLPQEIQDLIYSYALGNGNIYIKKCPCSKRALSFHKFPDQHVEIVHENDCRWSVGKRPSNLGLYHLASNEVFPCVEGSIVMVRKRSDTGVKAIFIATARGEKVSSWTISLALLWTCRHIYACAMPILYSNYTFCLAMKCSDGWDPDTPKLFCMSLTPLQCTFLRTLSIRISLTPRIPIWGSDLLPEADFFDDAVVLGNYKEIIEGTPAVGLEGLAAFTSLQTLILEFICNPRLSMWIQGNNASTLVTLPLLSTFEGVKSLNHLQLHIIVWTWRRVSHMLERWNRVPVLEQRIKTRLKGEIEEGEGLRHLGGD